MRLWRLQAVNVFGRDSDLDLRFFQEA